MLAQIGGDLAGSGRGSSGRHTCLRGKLGLALGNSGLRQRQGYALWELII